jgi:hypothetical protein
MPSFWFHHILNLPPRQRRKVLIVPHLRDASCRNRPIELGHHLRRCTVLMLKPAPTDWVRALDLGSMCGSPRSDTQGEPANRGFAGLVERALSTPERKCISGPE